MTKRLAAYAVGGAFLVGLAAGVRLQVWRDAPPPAVPTPAGVVKVVTVDRPVLTTREVVRYVEDKARVAGLLEDQRAAGARIASLTETLATLKSAGAGPVVYVDKPAPAAREAHFKDWRLTFDAVGAQATYALSQRFEALGVVGKDAAGRPTADVRVFEVGPGEARTPLTDLRTTFVAAAPGASWRARLALQAGAGATSGGKVAAVVAAQWLARGTSRAAEDCSVALLTPALVVSGAERQPALLPVSVNLGRLPRQPLRDVWLSPFVGLAASGKVGLAGVALTASF